MPKYSKNSWKKYLAEASAATLGYIVGDLPGAYAGYKLTKGYLNKKQMWTPPASGKRRKMTHPDAYTRTGPGQTSSVNMLAQRASMKRTGRGALKSIRGSTKKVKVSPGLRAKIKKVIRAEDGYGVYHTTRQGTLAINTPAADTSRTTINQGGYTAELVAIRPGFDEVQGDHRTWLQSTFIDEGFITGDDFQYFTPLKFLDAASCLWNNKGMQKSYGAQSGNFTNSFLLATGAILDGNAAAPDKKGVDLHVVNSYVTWELKNNSQRCMNLEIYHCVPKVKFPEHLPLETLDSGIAAMQQDNLTAGVLLSNNPGDVNDALIANPTLQPKHVHAFNTVYKYEKVSIIIAPGETCQHSIQGPRNLDINFSKLYEGETDMGGKMWKHSSVCAMVAIKPDMVYATAGVATIGAAGSGRFNARLADGNTIQDMISVEIKEVFKLSMPDDTGFVQRTTVAGETMTLNLKRKVKGFANFSSVTTGDVTYNAYEEENATIAVPDSATN